MRGEKGIRQRKHGSSTGSPPLARGKVPHTCHSDCGWRVTPACAGKRSFYYDITEHFQDHPRLRGEKHKGHGGQLCHGGSPPLARGKDWYRFRPVWVMRITPACAGKRAPRPGIDPYAWDHPRLRGEKDYRASKSGRMPGSPPLARGKVEARISALESEGITPACAGKRMSGRNMRRS